MVDLVSLNDVKATRDWNVIGQFSKVSMNLVQERRSGEVIVQ